MKPEKGYAPLRRYRVTIPHASYFLTLCTHNRMPGLTEPVIAAAVRSEIDAMEVDGTFKIRGAVLMPDHFHLLVQIAEKLTVGQIVGRLKSKTRGALSAAGLRWQGNFYEHRMRPEDGFEDVLRYLFLNPYRARLLSSDKTYPHFWLGTPEAEWFRPTLDDDRPFPQWLQ